jgi:hypothetical protein
MPAPKVRGGGVHRLTRSPKGLTRLLIFSWLLGACSRDSALAPRETDHEAYGTEAVSSSQSFFIPAGTGELAYYPTGITVPQGWAAYMQVRGIVTADVKPECSTFGFGSHWDVFFSGSNLGHSNGANALKVRYFLSSRPEWPNDISAVVPPESEDGHAFWRYAPDFPGELTFRREPELSGCWLFGGGQTIDVQLVTVDVAASKTSVASGDLVVFTATPVNFAADPSSTTLWTFYPDAGAPITLAPCQGQPSCSYSVTAPGKMSAQIMIGGVWYVEGFSASISIIKCPTGDPIIDGGLRGELERLMQKSLAEQIPGEFRGVIWQDRATGAYRFQELTPTARDPYGCYVTAFVPRSTATEKIVGEYHDHPHNHGDFVTCSRPNGKLYQGFVNYVKWGGFSPDDINEAFDLSAQEGAQIPAYVMDLKQLHKLSPISRASLTSWTYTTQHWNRCTP